MENLNPILIFKFMKIFWPPTIQTKKHLALIVNNTIVYKCSNLRIIISYNFMFKTTRYNMYNHCKKRSNHKRKTEVNLHQGFLGASFFQNQGFHQGSVRPNMTLMRLDNLNRHGRGELQVEPGVHDRP